MPKVVEIKPYVRRASPVGGVGQEREPEPQTAVDRGSAGRDEPGGGREDRRHGPADAQGLRAPVQ